MISLYREIIPRNDQILFGCGLEKARERNYGFDEESQGRVFRFACWVRNLDGEYETNWEMSAAKVGVACLAVFGMLLLCPFIAGIFLIDKFVTANRNITKILDAEKWAQQKEIDHLEKRKLLIEKLGGKEAFERFKVVDAKEISFIGKVKGSKSYFPAPYVFKDEDKTEIENVFQKYKTPIVQADHRFLAVWVQSKRDQIRQVLILFSNTQEWSFFNLSNEFLSNTRTPNFGKGFTSYKSIDTLSKMILGTHEEFELVKF